MINKKFIVKASVCVLSCLVTVALCLGFIIWHLYRPQVITPKCDMTYYWAEKSIDIEKWLYEELPTGHKYYLYLPPDCRENPEDYKGTIPLIITFHGSCEKYSALKYAKQFIKPNFQEEVSPEGCAVLAVLSRGDYFTDTHSMSLLIQNLLIKFPCLDASTIVGYGFSQGAKYVVELACAEPSLFKAVMSGSGFYQITFKELLSVLHISFYSALSRNDSGIYEQGVRTGRLCGRWCRDSRYVEYEKRNHFWIELKDKTGNGDETARDWLIKMLQS